MIVQSTRLGELEVPEEQIIDFPAGLPGFPDENKFAVFIYQPDSSFFILQSLANADLSFLMVNPFDFFNDYEFDLEDEQLSSLGMTKDNPPVVFNIATMKENLESMTVNLMAPVLVNHRDRKGLQMVIDKPKFPIRYPLFAKEAK